MSSQGAHGDRRSERERSFPAEATTERPERGFGRHSLFWTFAGAFLVVLVVAGILQIVLVALAVGPIATRWLADRAAIVVQDAEEELRSLEGAVDSAAVENVLRRHTNPPIHLLFVTEEGRVLGSFRRGGPDGGRSRRHEPPPGLTDVPRPPGPGVDRRHQVLVRVAIEMEPIRGELVAFAPRPRAVFSFWPAGAPPRLALFVPVAILVAGGAGLLLFRSLVRRLRSLEMLASRVATGDLDARVPSPGRDEIGRLGTQLNRMTERLAHARDHIDADDRARRQLLADISHELSTPLTSIRGFTETLLDASVDVTEEERRRYLCNVLEESKRLDALIRDLLELTRLEAGVELDVERLDWAALCRHTVERFAARFRTAGLALEWRDQSNGAPLWVRGDGRRLEQVLENLLVNALRYVPESGCVHVSVVPGRHGPRLIVTDDGPGFPPEDLPHVFDRFYRSDAARSTDGTGLGLAIVREIVERHAGSVRAENVPSGGAHITIELPSE